METFTRGEVDVLVATTIVENGIDIPSAGTILIDEAEHYGLAELTSCAGRVGRGSAPGALLPPDRPHEAARRGPRARASRRSRS
jgi:transcription-repair coupling factor (superfamily II helicase)